MKEDVKKFLEELSTNEELMTKLNSLNEKYTDRKENAENLIILAKEYGFEFTTLDFEEMINSQNSYELTDEELEEVAGGKFVNKGNNVFASNCLCVIGGGGTSDQYQKTCACVAAVAGELTPYGKQLAREGKLNFVGAKGAPVAMACGLMGSGIRND